MSSLYEAFRKKVSDAAGETLGFRTWAAAGNPFIADFWDRRFLFEPGRTCVRVVCGNRYALVVPVNFGGGHFLSQAAMLVTMLEAARVVVETYEEQDCGGHVRMIDAAVAGQLGPVLYPVARP